MQSQEKAGDARLDLTNPAFFSEVCVVSSADKFPDLSILQMSPIADKEASGSRQVLKSDKTGLLLIKSAAITDKCKHAQSEMKKEDGPEKIKHKLDAIY